MHHTRPLGRRLATAALPLLAAAAAGAEEPGPATTDGPAAWGLGLAAVTAASPYRGVDTRAQWWPVALYENRWLRLAGPGLEFKLGERGPLAFGLTATYQRQGYEADDSPALAGMDTRRSGAWLGARASLRGRHSTLTAEWAADAADHSRGQQLRFVLERRFMLGGLGLTPRLAAAWHDRRFVDYHYGVKTSEARADRPAYAPGSATDTEAGLRVDLPLAPGHRLFADLSVTGLGDAAAASPLVERRNLTAARLGYVQRF